MSHAFLTALMEVLDWIGTFVFAVSGGLIGVRKRFDLFGVLFLSFVVAVTGGISRDLLIGAVPPAAISDIRYFFIAVGAGLLTFYWYPGIASRQGPLLLLDAIGLALFAVVGTGKAIAHGINPVMAANLGMLSGIGGGMVRDVLAGDVPFVLRADLYALAALAAGLIVALGHVAGMPRAYGMFAGAAVCLLLRVGAIYFGWRAPIPAVVSAGRSSDSSGGTRPLARSREAPSHRP